MSYVFISSIVLLDSFKIIFISFLYSSFLSLSAFFFPRNSISSLDVILGSSDKIVSFSHLFLSQYFLYAFSLNINISPNEGSLVFNLPTLPIKLLSLNMLPGSSTTIILVVGVFTPSISVLVHSKRLSDPFLYSSS